MCVLQLASGCARYVGTDFSSVVLQQVQSLVSARDEYRNVELSRRMANDFHGFEAGDFDTVVVNSVVQYFPRMDYLVDVIGMDHFAAEPRFEVVYHLYSIPNRYRLRLKVRLDEEEAIPTVSGIWPAADWPERETYDMYGIQFEGHPNLKRIYMTPDWEGFPLRKDYPLKGYRDEYNPFGQEPEEDF